MYIHTSYYLPAGWQVGRLVGCLSGWSVMYLCVVSGTAVVVDEQHLHTYSRTDRGRDIMPKTSPTAVGFDVQNYTENTNSIIQQSITVDVLQ